MVKLLSKIFGRKPGAESRGLADHVDQIRVGRDSRVQLGPPSAFPVAQGVIQGLKMLLSHYESVAAAYLVQMTYVDNPDMSPEGRPCLTLCLEYTQGQDRSVHDQISIAAQGVVDGKLGEWRFIDIIVLNSSMAQVAKNATAPFYVKQT